MSENLRELASKSQVELKNATQIFYEAQMQEIATKHEHDKIFAQDLAAGTLYGKNEETRYGSFVDLHPELVERLLQHELDLVEARARLELARIDDTYVSRLLMMGYVPWSQDEEEQEETT